MKIALRTPRAAVMLALLALAPGAALASSHMDAPLITFDDAANTTDVYAFVSQPGSTKYLTVALAVYPFEEPGIGPNKYAFDENVRYEIHVALGSDISIGEARYSYQFEFVTRYKSSNTILQSYLGIINKVDDANQNLTQTYRVFRVDNRTGQRIQLGSAVVPPNNQGIATPLYNQGDDGEMSAKEGVAKVADLDPYTAGAVHDLSSGYRVFAGQREDGFYGDIQAIFDLLSLRSGTKARDAQKGYNVHTIVLQIPVTEIGGDQQSAGVFATTSRRESRVLSDVNNPVEQGAWIQVGRQGNPLFCEAFVAIADKDAYNRSKPSSDRALFRNYATNPELATLINVILGGGKTLAIDKNRTDLAGIFIPDLITVDLSTGPARLAGGGKDHLTNPDDAGFSNLSIFGNDTLTSKIQEGFGAGVVPGGWPNGRRFGDDVVDIAVTAALSDLRVSPPVLSKATGDGVDGNDAVYNKVMPYAGTPHNGRIHVHH